MNENQKSFLKELTVLFDKYNIDEMLIFNDRITMSSNNEVLAFRGYVKRSDKELSYFTDVLTKESRFVTKGED